MHVRVTTIAQRTTNNDNATSESETGTDAGDVDRRGFLKLLGLSGAGLGIGMLSSSPAAAATQITPSEVITDQTRFDSLILNSLTVDPSPVEQGQLFYRSDVDEIRYSPDGTATKQIGGGAAWSEITNKPVLPEGVATAVILRMQLSDAEQRFAATLAQRNYDDMFVDPYVDQSKIASTSNVTVNDGQDGNIELKTSTREFDGFEDGDYTSNPVWDSTNDSDTTVQTGTVKNGSNSLAITNNSSVDHNRGSDDAVEDGDVYQMWVRPSTTDYHSLKIRNGTGLDNHDAIQAGTTASGDFRIITWDGSENQIANTSGGSYSTDNWYLIEIELNPSDSEATMRVYDESDNEIVSITESTSGASNLQYIRVRGGDGTNYFDDISYGTDAASNGKRATSGTVTSVQKDLGYSPDKMQVLDDATVPANTDLSYTIRDENGNTVDVPRSALESDVDTSALTGTQIELLSNFSGDGSSTPTQQEVGWISV